MKLEEIDWEWWWTAASVAFAAWCSARAAARAVVQAIYVWDTAELVGLLWPMKNVLGAEVAGVDTEQLLLYVRLRRGRVGVCGLGAAGRRAGRSERRRGR
eukprot:14888860-Alexandrium_andersonii.AAC.1